RAGWLETAAGGRTARPPRGGRRERERGVGRATLQRERKSLPRRGGSALLLGRSKAAVGARRGVRSARGGAARGPVPWARAGSAASRRPARAGTCEGPAPTASRAARRRLPSTGRSAPLPLLPVRGARAARRVGSCRCPARRSRGTGAPRPLVPLRGLGRAPPVRVRARRTARRCLHRSPRGGRRPRAGSAAGATGLGRGLPAEDL